MAQPAVIPFQQLLDAMLDVNTPLHPRFLFRLSDLDRPEVEKLEQIWPKVPEWRRQALLEDIEELGEKDTLLSFEALGRLGVRDSHPGVRLSAIHILWEYEQPSLIPIYLDLLERDSDAEVRAAAALGLGYFVLAGELEEIRASTLHHLEDRLMEVIQGEDEAHVRRNALLSLGYSSREEVPALIEAAYTSGNKEWIASALSAMGRSANEQWRPQVLEMLNSKFPLLRSEAAHAAGELEISEAVPLLLELMEDPDDDVHSASIWSLSQIGGEGVSEALQAALVKADDDDEIEFLEDALNNLAFTEGVESFRLFDIPDEESDEDYLEDDSLDLDEDYEDDEFNVG